MGEQYFGWDIGGAHLKVASLDGAGDVRAVRQIACPLWRGVQELARAAALIDFPFDGANAVHAVTMTGELCDIFPDRAAGVRRIIAQFAALLGAGARMRVFGGYAGWLTPAEASAAHASAVASANWLALAAYTAELVGDGLLLDIGSTTTDVVPIAGGEVRARGRDDASRLACGELVYTGVVRTPVIGICRGVPFRGHWQPLAAEVFATAADVYRLLGLIDERHDLMPSADGGAKDVPGSARRLARMLGHDLGSDELAEQRRVATFIATRQRRLIEDAMAIVASEHPAVLDAGCVIGAGAGRFVAAAIARAGGHAYRDFAELLGIDRRLADEVAIAAPAVAAARLAWMTA